MVLELVNLGEVFYWRGYPSRWVCVGGGSRVLVSWDYGDHQAPGWCEPVGEDACDCARCKTMAA